mmetsp:Transcript_36584/g.58690  ORF Transcript_36584/g.58690 Transcript_36584/m.58690 type:complete len:181 (+) Transcript_36584:255-797(+)
MVRRITNDGEVTTMELAMEEKDVKGVTNHFYLEHGDGIVFDDKTGALICADAYGQTLELLTPSQTMETYAGCEEKTGNQDGTQTNARFWGLQSIAADESGNIYVADGLNQLIRKVLPDRTVLTLAGDKRSFENRCCRDGASNVALFNLPSGIDVASDGDIVYVTEKFKNIIRKIVVQKEN